MNKINDRLMEINVQNQARSAKYPINVKSAKRNINVLFTLFYEYGCSAFL